jgi:hypothetical protein
MGIGVSAVSLAVACFLGLNAVVPSAPLRMPPRPATLTAADWKHWWGESRHAGDAVTIWSRSPLTPETTFSALVTSKRAVADTDFSFTTATLEQLRLRTSPNAWEVGWAMFRFRDLENYYYFILKPNGFELGKKHGSDAQIFLVTGESPALTLGREHHVRIVAIGARIRIWVDGAEVIDFTDPDPITSGAVGLYEEDAKALFRDIALNG